MIGGPGNSKRFIEASNGHSFGSNRDERTRVLDGYHTPRIAVETLLEAEQICDRVWEPANGFSRISRVLREYNYEVFTSDIFRWHDGTDIEIDFLSTRTLPKRFQKEGCDILTNPPFVRAQEFIEHGLSLVPRGRKVIMLLRLQFLEGIKRSALFSRGELRRVHVYSFRLPRMNRFLYRGPQGGSTIAFAWFVFSKGYRGPTELRWISRPKTLQGEQRWL